MKPIAIIIIGNEIEAIVDSRLVFFSIRVSCFHEIAFYMNAFDITTRQVGKKLETSFLAG